jgi:hypothetical protein
MYARAVDDAALELRGLRQEEWEDLGLAALALGLAVGAAQILPALALPLFLGGLAVGARGVRALWLRWDLVERLAGDDDAYVIPEVLARARREATMDRRRTFAVVIRSVLSEPYEERLAPVARNLEALAVELEDPGLALDPSAAVACFRLVDEPLESPLLDPEFPAAELRARVERVRVGFSPRRPAG